MIGGFFVFRSLSRRSKVKAVTSKVAATHASSNVRTHKWDDDFDDDDDYEERYDETGEFNDEDEEQRDREEEQEEQEEQEERERWTYEEDGQDDNSSRDDD